MIKENRIIKKFSALLASFILSFIPLFVMVPTVHAAAVTWDGEGSDNNFSTATNWAGDVSPSNGDILTFPTSVDADTITGDDRALNNDIIGLDVAGIQVTGTYITNDVDWYEINGNAFSTSANILGNSTDTSYPPLLLGVALTVTAPVTLQSVASTSSLAIGSNAVTLKDASFSGALTGSGNITIDGYAGGAGAGSCGPTATSYPFGGSGAGYSGALTVQSDGRLTISQGATGVAQNANAITKASDGYIIIAADNGLDMTLSTPMTFNGGDAGVFQLIDAGCNITAKKTITLSGNLTFTADTTFAVGNVDLKLTGTVTGKQYVKILYSSTGSIIFADNSTITPTTKMTDYAANSPSTSIFVYNNEIAVVTGTYGYTYVDMGGVLKGNGTVGVLNVLVGGKLAPGLSPGCISSGNLTLAGNYDVEIGGTTVCTEYDQTIVTGTVNVTGGTLNVSRYNNFKPVAGQKYTIISNDVADAVTGTFTNLAEGATFTVDGYVLKISYVGGDGNDVVLTVQSVPATPNTGFQLLSSNPVTTLVTTTLLAVGIAILARRYGKIAIKK